MTPAYWAYSRNVFAVQILILVITFCLPQFPLQFQLYAVVSLLSSPDGNIFGMVSLKLHIFSGGVLSR